MSYIDDLFELIIDDKHKSNTYDRYPIRFLFSRLASETYDDITELIGKFSSYKNKDKCFNEFEIVNLSSFLSYDDAWITRQKLYNKIKSLDTNKDYLILGFSELARFYSKADLESLVMSFMTDIESNSGSKKQRIYFMCFSLFDKLVETLKMNGRNANINPVICMPDFEANDSICVYYANSKFGSEYITKNIISSTKQWLSLYDSKNIDYSKGIVCLSDTLVSIYEMAKPDNFVEIYKIDSYFNLLTRMNGMSFNYSYSYFEDEFWKRIFELSVNFKTNVFKTIALKYLKVQEISSNNFIDLFNKTDLSGKRVLYIYVCENQNDIQYAYYLIKILNLSVKNDFSSFISDIVTNYDNLFDQANYVARRFYINILFKLRIINREYKYDLLKETINKSFNDYLNTQIFNAKLDFEDLLKFNFNEFLIKYKQDGNYIRTLFTKYFKLFMNYSFTGLFQIEQHIIINLLKENLLNLDDALLIYPDLKKYIGSDYNQYVDSSIYWLLNYICEYRKSKIYSAATDAFLKFSGENTEEYMFGWYYNSSVKHQQDEIDKNKFDKLIVLDGVGIEYFDYIIEIIKDNGRFINYANYAKAYLPTITTVNKAHIKNYDKWITDFDSNCIHGTVYNSIKQVPDTLAFLKEMINKLIDDNPNSSICITADHGCTSQSKIIPTIKKYNFKKSDHEGRCMDLSDLDISVLQSEDYCKYHDESTNKDYIVSLNNNSLDDKPIRESHGGATVEECFVPCIVFSPSDVSKNYNVRIINNKINGLDRKILIEVTPKVDKNILFIEENGNTGVFKFEEKNTWSAEMSNIVSQNLTIKIGDYENTISIISSSGIAKKGDDGFDD